MEYERLLVAIVLAALLQTHDCAQICSSCTNMTEIDRCHHVEFCEDTQICYVQKYMNLRNETRYNVGCINQEFCRKDMTRNIHKKRNEFIHVLCQRCCNDKVCNTDLTCNDNLEVTAQSCLTCTAIESPEFCKNTAFCKKDEVCFLHKYLTNDNQKLFDMGCKDSSLCLHQSNTNIFGRRFSSGRQLLCEACCDGNDNCNGHLNCSNDNRRPYNSPCSTSQECKEPLKCTQNTCICISSQYWTGTECLNNSKECMDITSNQNGIYTIYPNGIDPVKVYCIMDNDKKWTVIQRRMDGLVSFDRTWSEYKLGFGSITGEYWLGNDNIHLISSNGLHEISFYLEEYGSKFGYANYSTFSVGDEQSKYILTISGYIDGIGDSMDPKGYTEAMLNGQKFTTSDQDNDLENNNCADIFGGGWWYHSCAIASLNDRYASGIRWYPYSRSLTKSIMMIRKTS